MSVSSTRLRRALLQQPERPLVIDRDNRWMPPSPHREKVIEELEQGRMILVERGHGLPPLVRHEDGGVLELPTMRWNGQRWVAEERADASPGQTSYQDVCGSSYETFDILKSESPLSAPQKARIRKLQEDIMFMIERMQRRNSRYLEFAAELEELAAAIKRVSPPARSAAAESIRKVREAIEAGGPKDAGERQELLRLAENVRQVGQGQEDALAERKDLAVKVMLLFNAIRGARNWDEAVERLSSKATDAHIED